MTMPNISNAVVNLIIVSPPLLRQTRHPLEEEAEKWIEKHCWLTKQTQEPDEP